MPHDMHPDHAAYAATLAPRQLELARRLATPVTAESVTAEQINAEMLQALKDTQMMLEVVRFKGLVPDGCTRMLERIDAIVARAEAV